MSSASPFSSGSAIIVSLFLHRSQGTEVKVRNTIMAALCLHLQLVGSGWAFQPLNSTCTPLLVNRLVLFSGCPISSQVLAKLKHPFSDAEDCEQFCYRSGDHLPEQFH